MAEARYLNHRLECPYCKTIRLRIPEDANPDTPIACDDCGEYLGSWDELQPIWPSRAAPTGCSSLRRGGSRGLVSGSLLRFAPPLRVTTSHSRDQQQAAELVVP